MRKTVVTILLSVICVAARSQQLSELYYVQNPTDAAPEAIVTDTMLFYRPVLTSIDFYSLSRYSFGFVSNDYRFLKSAETSVLLGNSRIVNPFSRSADYSTLNILRRMPSRQYSYTGSRARPFAVGNCCELFDPLPDALPKGASARLIYSERGYCGGGVGRYVGSLGRWAMTLSAGGKFGPDRHIKGVSTDEAFATITIARLWPDSTSLTITALGGYSLRGGRNYTTAEVYELTSDKYYNTAIGYLGGRLRNARQTRETAPLVAAELSTRLLGRRVNFAALVQGGFSARSDLGWYDAASPLPDRRNALPSYFADGEVAEAVRQAWQSGDERYTTICWDELCRINMASGGAAHYILFDREELRRDAQLSVSGERTERNGLSLRWGVTFGSWQSRFGKRMRDLLCGGEIEDTDAFVESDDKSGPNVQNNTLTTGRLVGVGDRFGYDYTMRRLSADAFVVARYAAGRSDASLSVALCSSNLDREGHFCKESSPDGWGRGRSTNLTTLSTVGDWRCRLSPLAILAVTARYTEHEPYYADLYRSPEASSAITSDPSVERRWGGEASMRLSFGSAQIAATLYGQCTSGGIETIRFYNDLMSVYVDMAVSGIATRSAAAEVVAVVGLWQSLSLTAMLSFGSCSYRSSAKADFWNDADGSALLTNVEIDLKGSSASSSPRLLSALKVDYSTLDGWHIGLEGAVGALRIEEANLYYHTPQVAAAAALSQTVDEFTGAERLPDAFNLNLSLYRRFTLNRGSLTLTAQLRNLTDSHSIQNSYRLSRIAVGGVDTARSYRPYDRRRVYSSPRNLYIAIGYEF
ncbi:MAG: hypothetical protein SOZ00_07405 [Tidjanibacter sp.]|nr:hypothetical protein [Tidjanibacter sp.]